MQLETPPTVGPKRLPILPLRDVVVYPHMVIPLFVGREKSVVALDRAMASNKEILLVAQMQADVDEPQPKDLYSIGTIATVLQLLKLPDGTVKVLVEGAQRTKLGELEIGDCFSAVVEPLVETSATFLAIAPQHIGQLPLRAAVNQIFSAQHASRRIAHVQRSILSEGESALRPGQVDRGQAQVEQNALYRVETAALGDAFQFAEIPLQRDSAAPH